MVVLFGLLSSGSVYRGMDAASGTADSIRIDGEFWSCEKEISGRGGGLGRHILKQ